MTTLVRNLRRKPGYAVFFLALLYNEPYAHALRTAWRAFSSALSSMGDDR